MHEKPENYDLLSTVMIHLGEPDGENDDGVLQLLDVIFSDSASLQEKRTIMEDAFQIPMTMEMDKEVSGVCNLSEGVFQRGVERGLKQGLAQGRQEGLEEGRQQGIEEGHQQGLEEGHQKGLEEGHQKGLEEGHQQGLAEGRESKKLANIRCMMEALKLTAVQAMSVLKVPEAEQGKYLALLNT